MRRRFAPGSHWPAFAATAVALLTLLFFTQYDGFEPLSGNLLANADFADGLKGWQWRGTPGKARATAAGGTPEAPGYMEIRNADPAHSATLWQVIAAPGRFPYVSVEFELLLERVVSGGKPEHKARIVLASYDAAGNGLWHHPHIFVVEDGSHGWKRYRATFPVGRDVSEMHLMAQLNRATGLLRLRGLSLRGAAARPDRSALQGLLIALWAALGLMLARTLLRPRRGRRAAMIALALAALFLLGTLSPKQFQLAAENQIVALFSPDPAPADAGEAQGAVPANTAKRPAQPPDFELLRPGKFAHLILFALFGFALALSRPRAAGGIVLASLLLAAAYGEVLQFFTPGRTPAFQDIAINAIGAILGGGAVVVSRRFGLGGARRR